MRNYALHQAEISGSLPGSGLLTRLIDNWRARRAIAKLDRLDDFLLHDIGLSRQDIASASHIPLTRSPVVALQEIASQRRLTYGKELYVSDRKAAPTTISAVRPS
jgi:uncharacterized protein YjiS (DUF1127 family)